MRGFEVVLVRWRPALAAVIALTLASALHARQVPTSVTLPNGNQTTAGTPALDDASLQNAMSKMRDQLQIAEQGIAANTNGRLTGRLF